MVDEYYLEDYDDDYDQEEEVAPKKNFGNDDGNYGEEALEVQKKQKKKLTKGKWSYI